MIDARTFLVALLCTACAAQDESIVAASVADSIRDVRERAAAPAIGAVYGCQAGAPRIFVDGVRLAGEADAVLESDVWHWGSITKSMTATLVARLVERGDIAWEDTVEQRLGGLVSEIHEAYRTATFRHLFAHAGGFQANLPSERFGEFRQRAVEPISDRLRWTRLALVQEPHAPAGHDFQYSNNGYIVAGAMLEAATGKSWEELMRREVFEPLGIEGAGFGAPRAGQPRGHTGEDEPVPDDTDNPAALGPAGRVHMPLAGMARYLRAHATRDPSFLSRASWNELLTPRFEAPYALGWFCTAPQRGWHNGTNTMWYAEACFDRASGTYAAVVVNDGELESVKEPVNELLNQLMEEALPAD